MLEISALFVQAHDGKDEQWWMHNYATRSRRTDERSKSSMKLASMLPCKEEEDDSQLKQISTDQKINQILDQLEEGTLKQKAHIFSAGYIYEAKSFIESLISQATTRVILVDGYISSETIDLLDARPTSVPATIYTSGVGPALRTLMQQYNTQYPTKPLNILKWRNEQLDRWLILDDQLWHVGASIKDAGLKTFGIAPIGLDPNIILSQM